MGLDAEKRTEIYASAWTSSLALLLSQLTAETWQAQEAAPPPDYVPAFCIGISAAGVVGQQWVSFSQADLKTLLGIFLSEEIDLSDRLGDMQREAVEELLRQWCGLAATTLKDAFGEVSFRVAVEPQTRPLVTSFTRKFLRAACGSRSIGLLLEFDDFRRNSALEARTDAALPAPTHPRNGNRVEELLQEGNLELLMGVELGVLLRFGSREATLREILDMATGALLELNREIQEPVELVLNGKIIARGEVVVIDGNYGLRVSEVASAQQCFNSL